MVPYKTTYLIISKINLINVIRQGINRLKHAITNFYIALKIEIKSLIYW